MGMKLVLYTSLAGLLLLSFISIAAAFTFESIDISKWTVEYKQEYKKTPISHNECFMEKTDANKTVHPGYCITIVDRYEMTLTDTDKVIGVSDGEELIKNSYKQDNIISIWTVPIGDRNFIEYGKCRDYEKLKGVCSEK